MPPRTRRKAKSAPSTSPSTPATAASTLFSNKTSPTNATPATSDIDAEDDVLPQASQTKAKAKRTSTTRSTRKRPAESDEEDVDPSPVKPPVKKRILTNKAYVAVPAVPPSLIKAKLTKPSPRNTKGKGKAPVPSPEVDSADEIVPDSEEGLEYDENASLDEDEDDSGSNFEEGDSESDGDEEEEEVLLARSRQFLSPNKRRASAVVDLDDLDEDEDDEDGTPSGYSGSIADSEDEEIPLVLSNIIAKAEEEINIKATGKPEGKGKGKKNALTAAEKRKLSVFERKMINLKERNQIKYEEAMLVHKLGRSLTWSEKSSIQLNHHHPELRDAWGDLEAKVEVVTPKRAEQPSGLKVKLLPFQQESLCWMRAQELGPYAGGLLADEMGMGKTIQMISLMVSDAFRPNLVIAPTVAIMQWRNEIEAHTTDMKVLVWHGAAREADPKELKKYDVVLTTYSVLESCFRKQESGFKRKGMIVKEKSPIHALEWSRVILDEAHNIKERVTNTAKATFQLKAKAKWCLSGTPLQNRVGELYSLIRFIGMDPFAYYYCKKCPCKSLHWRFANKKHCDECGHTPMVHTCYWNNEVLSPIQKSGMVGPGKIAFKKLRILLDRVMLRRTKIQRADDLGLPPRTVIVRRDYFSPEEKELYLSLFSDAKREFSTYVDAGTLLNNYSNVFSLLTRMRQMACHPDLVLRSKNNAGKFNAEEGEYTLCRLCNDIAEDAIQAKCRHIFDRECIKQYLNTAIEVSPACPVCHLPLTIDLEGEAIEVQQPQTARQGILGRLNIETWRSSTKIEALVEELSNLRRQDSTTKSIVFSQFVNFLDLIAFRLQKAGFVVCRLEGTMSPQARDATIQYFMNNVHVAVFLVSLKAGGVALNLTEASRVYLMDSWWNPAVEYQAMDRIHRLGQHRPVQAIKLVVEDSIESRIVQLQEKKSAMVDATLSTDDSAMGRLTPEDLGFLFRL